jgi:hypothetical protein
VLWIQKLLNPCAITSPNNSVEKAIERIKAIDWKQDNEDSKLVSHVKFFREHVRRMAIWFRALGLDFKGSGWPSVDITAQIDPSLIDEGRDERRDEELIKLLGVGDCRYYERYFSGCYAHWAMVRNRPEIMQIALPAPYEPVIMMSERSEAYYPKLKSKVFVLRTKSNSSKTEKALQHLKGEVSEETYREIGCLQTGVGFSAELGNAA